MLLIKKIYFDITLKAKDFLINCVCNLSFIYAQK